MANIKIFGDSFTVVSEIELETIKALKKFKPEALTLKDQDGNEVFAVTQGAIGMVSKYGVVFTSVDANGFATVTLGLPTGLSNEEKINHVKETVAEALVKLNTLEDQIVEQASKLGQILNAVAGSIEIVG